MPSHTDRLLFDASPLLHASRADRLDVLASFVDGAEWATTQAVMDEVRRNSPQAHEEVSAAKWIEVVRTDSLEFLTEFGVWSTRMGLVDDHNIGETTLCAYAACSGGTIVMDDRRARRVAERYGLRVRGTAGLLADACSRGECTAAGASALADALSDSGMRLPFARGGFEDWARYKGLLA